MVLGIGCGQKIMNKLWLRLSLSFLAATLLVIGIVAWVVHNSVESSFSQYVSVSNRTRFGTDLVAEIENYYAENQSWDGVEALLPNRGHGDGSSRDIEGARGAQVFVADTEGNIVAATAPDSVGLALSSIGPSRQIPLYAHEQQIGSLAEQTPGTIALNEAEATFSHEVSNGLILTGIGGGLVTFALGIGLSYSLTRPLQSLTKHVSTWQLKGAQGEIKISGTDEVQRLAQAFNDLMTRLAAGEVERQRMSADIAHELRTPVTVMRGHLEAMMDGIYPLDMSHLGVAYNQVLHLVRLVEDLRLLTQAEAGRLPLKPNIFDLVPLINASVARFEPLIHDRAIVVETHLVLDSLLVYADSHRIQQVLDNLLSNAIRHSPEAGQIVIKAWQQDDHAAVSIYNQSAEQLDQQSVAHLFDRFWRSESARERDTGGSGLGLAITRELLRIQGGNISATVVDDGLRFTFILPLRVIASHS